MAAFATVLTVDIQHGFYQGACRDFDFTIPADSQALLRNGKSFARIRDGRLYVLCEMAQPGVPASSLSGRHVQIGLRLRNPAFSNFTDLSGLDIDTPVFRNAADPATLDAAVPHRLAGDQLSHRLAATDRPMMVRLRDSEGIGLFSETLSAEDPRDAFALNLAPYPTGVLLVEEQTGSGISDRLYYHQPEFFEQGVFGIIDLRIDGSFYSTPPQFSIPFSARSDVLKYYVVARKYSNDDMDELSVADAGDGTSIQFNKLVAGSFGSDDIPADLLLDADAAAKAVLFKSTGPVARREQARSKIQLKKKNDVLMGNLPSPSASRPNADVIIEISNP
jgi:hypothetical protein